MGFKVGGDPIWAALIRDNQWTRTIDLGGYSIHYLDAGTGPVVVMLHGFGDSVYSWRWNIQAFVDKGFRVVVVDLPGMGQSGRPRDFAFTPSAMALETVKLLSHLGIGRASFMGNSLGGNVALYLAIHSPSLVDRLILADPACYFLGIRQRLITSAIRCGMVKKTVRLFIKPWIFKAAYWQAFYNPRLIRPEMVAESAQILNRPDGPDNLIDTAGLYFGHVYQGMPRWYGTIKSPTLMIWGEHDRVIRTRPNAKRLNRAISGSRLVIMPDVGHAPHQEQPEAFNKIVLDYLQREK